MRQSVLSQRRTKHFRRLVTVLATSALRLTWTVPWRLPWNKFLAFNTRFISGKMNDGFDGYNGYNGHNSHNDYDGFDSHANHSGPNSHSRVFILGQAEKSSIHLEDLLGGPGDVIPCPRQCRPTVCRERACLEDLPGCRQPSGWNSPM